MRRGKHAGGLANAGGESSGGRSFSATRWSLVLAAAGDAEAALAALCRGYWFPLYAFVRRQGIGPHDAEDLTQGFFAHLLGKGALAHVDRRLGRFRTFLLASLKHFLADERDRAQALICDLETGTLVALGTWLPALNRARDFRSSATQDNANPPS